MSKYKGKKILLASMHQKEIAISPPFTELIDCEIIVPENFNTDQFGTFSGEINRDLPAYETLKKKALCAAEIYDFDYVISSEGSFGPHPSNPFVNADLEMLLLYDRTRELFIADYEISMDTNHAELEISKSSINTDNYSKWLKQVKFPSHALILKSGSTIIQKGICNISDLDNAINEGFKTNSRLKLETDMRAMVNPSRMSVIHGLAHKLAKRIITECIKCGTPGFGSIEKAGNLRCELCLQETNVPQFINTKCLKCDYFEQTEIKPGVKFTDPRYCDYCNP
jgi:hypothetical protein